MKCPNCGAESEGKFCPNCGAKLEADDPNAALNDFVASKLGVSSDTVKSVTDFVGKVTTGNVGNAVKNGVKNSVVGAAANVGIEAIRAKAAAEEAERKRQDEEKRWKREHPEEAKREAKEERKSIYRTLAIGIGLVALIIGFCMFMSAREKGAI